MKYVIKSGVDNVAYKPRGAAIDFLYSRDPEIIISGPAETGKTLAACWKIHTLATKYPGAQLAIVRKTQNSMAGSVLQTYKSVIKDAPVIPYGGERPEKYLYKNGSCIWVAGMDNADKVLSSERDAIYVNQAEELTVDDWEILGTRATGRAGNIPIGQLMGDCNPSGSKHWIKEREKAGVLKLLYSTHRDNPTLYNEDGTLTIRGVNTINRLKNLSGMRHKRLYLGEWSTAEGVIYDTFDASIHVLNRQKEHMVRFGLACDEGYTNPAVIMLIGEDSDGRWHIFEEFYERGKLQAEVVSTAKDMSVKNNIYVAAVDSSAAGLIADMRDSGIPAHPSTGRVLDGIQNIQDRLKVQPDGLPRLTVSPDCVNVINEFESYVWKPGKDEPVKENDHAMDGLRYYDNATGTSWLVS